MTSFRPVPARWYFGDVVSWPARLASCWLLTPVASVADVAMRFSSSSTSSRMTILKLDVTDVVVRASHGLLCPTSSGPTTVCVSDVVLRFAFVFGVGFGIVGRPWPFLKPQRLAVCRALLLDAFLFLSLGFDALLVNDCLHTRCLALVYQPLRDIF